jgi:hypothetical protein
MMVVSAVKDCLVLLRQHSKIAGFAFILGAAGWIAVGQFWPKHYTASALIAPNLQTAPQSLLDGQVQHEPTATLLQRTSSLQDWSGTVTRFKLYPNLVAEKGLTGAGEYLASQISMESVAASELGGGEAIRLSYTGQDRDLVAGVTEAVAEGFTKPVPMPQDPQTHASAQTNDDLYAPVVLPSLPEPAIPKAVSRPSKRSWHMTKNQLRNSGGHGKSGKTASKLTVSERASRRRGHTPSQTAALLSQLRASLVEGAKLREALDQNAATLDDLRKQQQKSLAPPAPLPKAPAPPRPIDIQLERLHQELAAAQRNLDTLRLRYTDEYPDVVLAREKVQDIQLDLTRLTAAARTGKPQPQPEPKHAPPVQARIDPAVVAAQINQAEAAQTNLREALERNQNETARLETAIAGGGRSKNSEASSSLKALSSLTQGSGDQLETQQDDLGDVTLSSTNSTADLTPSTPSASPLMSAPFFLVRSTTIATTPFFFAGKIFWPFSLVFGILAAMIAAWAAERRDPSIRNEGMLLHELPPSAVYLGGIPRIRHEVVAD